VLFPVPSLGLGPRILGRYSQTVSVAATITTGATAHEWTAPVNLFSSTTEIDTGYVQFGLHNTVVAVSTGRSDTLLDLMFGAAGAEYSVVTVPIGGRLANGTGITLPLEIPLNTRVSARIKSVRTSTSFNVALGFYERPPFVGRLPCRWVTYGLTDDASNSNCTNVNPSASVNTWGSWTEIDTTDYEHELWVPVSSIGAQTACVSAAFRIQWGLFSAASAPSNDPPVNGIPWEVAGATSSTEQLAWDWGWAGNVVGGAAANGTAPLWQPAAAGTPISARSISGTASTPSGQIQLGVLAAVM
jgi:hypothetical protein